MDKQLILKAVQAVMDFNELDLQYMGAVQVNSYSVWIYIMDVDNGFQYVLTNQNATDADIQDFIQKLDELKAVEYTDLLKGIESE